MKAALSSRSIGHRGVVAVEFALVAPVLLLLLGGVVDFGLLIAGRSQLANGLAQGAQYASQQGPPVSVTAVQNIVKEGSSLAGVKPLVDVTVTGPACYCASGSPISLSPSEPPLTSNFTCTGSCPNQAGSTSPGIYLTIVATYQFQPLMPLYSRLASPVNRQATRVRLQ
jgi:hypothetical protein